MEEYRYHVFYAFSRDDVGNGTGVADVTLPQPIRSEDDVKKISEELARKLKAKDVYVCSFSLYGGEENNG